MLLPLTALAWMEDVKERDSDSKQLFENGVNLNSAVKEAYKVLKQGIISVFLV